MIVWAFVGVQACLLRHHALSLSVRVSSTAVSDVIQLTNDAPVTGLGVRDGPFK